MQKNKILSLIFTAIIFLFATPSFALLIEYDYVRDSGDKLLTFDSSSGLEWLDLTATRGRSVNQIEAGFGGYISNGFRYATGSELLDMFISAGAPAGTYSDAPHIFAIQTLMLMLGVTYQHNPPSEGNPFGQQSTWGVTGDKFSHSASIPGRAYAHIGATDSSASLGIGGQFLEDSNDYLVGSFLVRPATVPEPNSALLVGLGLLLLAFRKSSIE